MLEYITPNSLLLGRASPRGDIGDFDFAGYPYKRLRVIQGEIKKFWGKWSQLAGPNLFIRSKWHTKERNVAVGDIVWVADQNALRSQYKLGRVIKVNADSKGIVRDVDVRVFASHPVFCSGPGKAKTRTIKSESTKFHRCSSQRCAPASCVDSSGGTVHSESVTSGFRNQGCQVGGVTLKT